MTEGLNHYPPGVMIKFLQWFCPPELLEGIAGDLQEQFEADLQLHGSRIAKRNFAMNVFKFFRPGIVLRNKFDVQLTDLIMFSNYLMITYRNVLKSKVFSGINVLGLALGLATCLFIFQFVSFELSYDKFNSKFDRIYRVTNDRFQHGKLIQHGTIMYPTIGPTMAKDYPEIEMYTRMMPGGDLNVKAEDKIFTGQTAIFADEHFFSVFDFPLLAGDRKACLKEGYSMALSESTAKKYFTFSEGNYSEVLGRVLYWGTDPQPFKITAVFKDVPDNSHLQFEALVSYSSLFSPQDMGADNSWTWSDMRHYLVLKPDADPKELEAKFPAFSDRYFQGDKVSGSVEKFYLQPLKDAHLFSNYEYDIAKTASGKAVWAMLIVAISILVLAWINYINLTTSRAIDRAKEVGLRKVMGAFKSQLVRQFILESVLISFVAFILAMVIVTVLQGSFNELIEANLSWGKIFVGIGSSTIWIFAAIMFSGMILSGFYPAFILSSYQPATVLKGKFQRSGRGQYLRKSLVIFQFTASAALITATLIVSRQLKFMNEADLGINIHNTIIVSSPMRTAWDSTFIDRVETFKTELGRVPGVISTATSSSTPGDRTGRAFGIRLKEHSADSHYTMSVVNADYNYFDTYRVALVAGRKFTPLDHNVEWEKLKTVIINVQATKLLGISSPEEAIGKEIIWGNNGTRVWTIVGVVNDYHQESLRNPKEPMIFRPSYSTYHDFSVLVEAGNPKQTVARIEDVYKKAFPDNVFQYRFLEEKYKRQYRDDTRFGKVVTVFMILGIVISCLGLIALSSYTAVQRTKEIGIRKVLGASLTSIVSLLSTDFIKLVVVAAILSLPLAWFGMESWLQGYAYKINITWLMFFVPVVLILIIAVITVSVQVLKTARLNPADTLKHE